MMDISSELYLKMYCDMLHVRKFEQALEREFKLGNVPGMLHTGIGQEATMVAVAHSLRTTDGLFPDHRSHGLLFLKGTPGERIMAELFGKATGVCSGKGGSLHSADKSVNNFGDNAVEGSFMVTALGVGLGWQMQGSDALVAVMLGDGTAGEGAWHESLNLAAAWKLPVLYCCVNNGYAISTPVGKSHATGDLYKFAAAYDMPSVQVDGNDLLAAYEATQKAVEHIRAGKGPYFIEYMTWRWQGLFMGEFREKEEVRYWKEEHEPIKLAGEDMVQKGIATIELLKKIENEVQEEIERWVTFAKQSPDPDPLKATTNVYIGWEVETR
ncbi:MAG: thiamine pyrophosphate-dependent dehydrogenase E1 component subunit alpha [Anaerolineaceae bacterium]|nr:thiamine pyrophosphate-dependent dehydrogenase E1 component subunit alpha [Anaerolineaceae bacterium]